MGGGINDNWRDPNANICVGCTRGGVRGRGGDHGPGEKCISAGNLIVADSCGLYGDRGGGGVANFGVACRIDGDTVVAGPCLA